LKVGDGKDKKEMERTRRRWRGQVRLEGWKGQEKHEGWGSRGQERHDDWGSRRHEKSRRKLGLCSNMVAKMFSGV
jgi:hypothetical protein